MRCLNLAEFDLHQINVQTLIMAYKKIAFFSLPQKHNSLANAHQRYSICYCTIIILHKFYETGLRK